MANEPESLAAAITEFAAGHDMTVVPAVPGAEGNRTVLLDAGTMDLTGFLELARKLGDGALYLHTETFGLDPEDVPAHLARHKGQARELQVAFASAGHGLLHFWEHTAPWYREWLDSEEARLLAEDDTDTQAAEQERTRLAREIAETIVADPEFRAASPLARNRRAEQLMPESADRQVRWDAAARAAEMANEQSAAAYEAVWDQLDEVVAEFLASPGWQKSASPAGKKKAAERFLTSRAGRFPAPANLRDELYSQAQRILKDRSGSELFLRSPARPARPATQQSPRSAQITVAAAHSAGIKRAWTSVKLSGCAGRSLGCPRPAWQRPPTWTRGRSAGTRPASSSPCSPWPWPSPQLLAFRSPSWPGCLRRTRRDRTGHSRASVTGSSSSSVTIPAASCGSPGTTTRRGQVRAPGSASRAS